MIYWFCQKKQKLKRYLLSKMRCDVASLWLILPLIATAEIWRLLCCPRLSRRQPDGGGGGRPQMALVSRDRQAHLWADRWRQRRQRLNGRGWAYNHWPSVPAAAEPVWFPGEGNTPPIDLLRAGNGFLAGSRAEGENHQSWNGPTK